MRLMGLHHERYETGTDGLITAIQDLSRARTVTEIQEVVKRSARRLCDADGGALLLRDGPFCHVVDEDAIEPLRKGHRLPLDDSTGGWTILNRQPAVVVDARGDERAAGDGFASTFVRSLVVVPIRTLSPIGAIGSYWATEHGATPAEVSVLQALADSTSVALENVAVRSELEERVRDRTAALEATNARLYREIAERKRAEEEVRQLSLSDELTGLYNRRGFMLLAAQELKVAQRQGRRCLVLYLDLDGLKRTNDTYGHDAGDRLLVAASRVLRRNARDSDVLGRLGGDEFAVCMQLGPHEVSVPAIVERLLSAARRADVHLSVGATASVPGQTTTLEDLLTCADAAMYRGRRARRSS